MSCKYFLLFLGVMSNQLKRKTAMVLHQIEESLGNFVLKNVNVESLNLESLENIHQREVVKPVGWDEE